jgi:hypothetical protein
MSLFASNWVLLSCSLIIAAPVMLWKIHDTASLEDDLEFTDESLEDVVPQEMVIGALDGGEELAEV